MVEIEDVNFLPVAAGGNLKKKIHVLKCWRAKDECDHHYCTGHTNFAIICSCGFISRIGSPTSSAAEVIQDHKLNVTAYHLGLIFQEK